MKDKFILIGLDDERSKKLSEVLGNKTCKKIIDFLSETKDASEKDISDGLRIPINTIEYNLKKLLDAGLIEKTKNFFWSEKGRKIKMYKLSNKSIIIQPKSKFVSSKIKSLLSVLGILAIATIFVRYFSQRVTQFQNLGREMAFESGEKIATGTSESSAIFISQPIWIWFLMGALIAIIIFTILNWRKL
jgi:predicted ArsR family transcriptional regulator